MGQWYCDDRLEEILRSYPVLRAQAALEEAELRHLFPSCTRGYEGGRPGGPAPDSTGDCAVRREERSHNMRRARAVELAVDALTATERELVRLMYFERWERYQVRMRLGIRRSRFFCIRRMALDKLAEVLLR